MFRHTLNSRASYYCPEGEEGEDEAGSENGTPGTEPGGRSRRVRRTATTYSRRITQPVGENVVSVLGLGDAKVQVEEGAAGATEEPPFTETAINENENAAEERISLQGFDRVMPHVEVTINFELYFKWLEIIIWITMTAGVIWALMIDFSKATSEYCEQKKNADDPASDHIYPFNILPSLSRSMSSFRIGLAIWTIAMAIVFVARLMSTHFLHNMYKVWYAHSTFNYIILKFAYTIDVMEIVALLMIPAFSLDCDPEFHSYFFYVFIVLTFTGEVIQYLTKFLKRAKNVVLDEEVQGYYSHIGLLVLLQGFFIAFMIAANLVHRYMCIDYLYSVFAIGEYITVIVNVRFKRDTIRFVK